MKIYKVVVAEIGSLAQDCWYLQALSLIQAVKKVERILGAHRRYLGWEAEQVIYLGDLKKGRLTPAAALRSKHTRAGKEVMRHDTRKCEFRL